MQAETQSNVEPLHSLAEAQEILGISRTTLYRLVKQGDLVLVAVAGRRLVEPAELRRLIASSRVVRDVGRGP